MMLIGAVADHAEGVLLEWANTRVHVDEAMNVISAGWFAGEEHLPCTGEQLRRAGKVLRIAETQQDTMLRESGAGCCFERPSPHPRAPVPLQNSSRRP